MPETLAAPLVWRVQVHLDLGAGATVGPSTVSSGQRDDGFALEPYWRQAGACADEIDLALTGIALAARRQPPAGPRLIEGRGRLVLSGSYLVSGNEAAVFPETVQQLTRRHALLQARVAGPWSPALFTAHQYLAGRPGWRPDHVAVICASPAGTPFAPHARRTPVAPESRRTSQQCPCRRGRATGRQRRCCCGTSGMR